MAFLCEIKNCCNLITLGTVKVIPTKRLNKSLKALRYVVFWNCCLMTCISFGQESVFQIPDSLKDKDYGYLYNRYGENYKDTVASQLYLNVYLAKGIISNNKIRQSIALNYLSYYAENKESQLDFINRSIIASNSVDSSYSIAPYNHLGEYYQYEYAYEKALQEYLRVLKLSKKYNWKDYEVVALNNIADLKKNIGKYNEALVLYKECFSIEQQKTASEYTSIGEVAINLAECFRKIQKNDSASYYYHYALDNQLLKNTNSTSKAIINEGVNLFYMNNMSEAQALLKKGASLANLNLPSSQKYYILSQFYLGKIFLSSDKITAKSYFIKVDSLLLETNSVIPEVRETYEFFITEYRANENYQEHLNTINKLLIFDSIAAVRKINTTDSLYAKFDTPSLIENKEYLIRKLENKSQSLGWKAFVLLLLTVSFSILFFLQFRKHKIYKKRFERIIGQIDNQQKPEAPMTVSKKFIVDSPTVVVTLEKLEAFEAKNGFLKNSITITSLAKKLSTNTKYLSRVINIYKEKSFIQYINDLRIDYMVRELKTNTTLQRYTIASIAGEAGFNSAKSFSDAFKKKTGITPSYYIKSLQNQKTSKASA